MDQSLHRTCINKQTRPNPSPIGRSLPDTMDQSLHRTCINKQTCPNPNPDGDQIRTTTRGASDPQLSDPQLSDQDPDQILGYRIQQDPDLTGSRSK